MTHYSVDDINCGALANGQAPAGDCTRYTGPFSISAPGDHTVSFFSFDQYGDTEGQNAIGVHIDTTPPVITLSAPENDALFVLNQQVPASYGCTDALSGVATCVAPVPSGTPIDTASAGTKTFQVQASDNAGNTATAEVSYRVTFNVCESSAARHGKGTATRLTIRVRLCDMNQADVSSRSIPVVVAGVTPGSRSAIRGRFRFSASGPGGPDYTLSVLQTQFKRGKYRLRFRAGADPITHSLTFTVR